MIICGRCGRRLPVVYAGRGTRRPVYRCDRPNLMLGLPRCLGFGGSRVDAAVAAELLRALEPMAVEAACEAERVMAEAEAERLRMFDLELQQARYGKRSSVALLPLGRTDVLGCPWYGVFELSLWMTLPTTRRVSSGGWSC